MKGTKDRVSLPQYFCFLTPPMSLHLTVKIRSWCLYMSCFYLGGEYSNISQTQTYHSNTDFPTFAMWILKAARHCISIQYHSSLCATLQISGNQKTMYHKCKQYDISRVLPKNPHTNKTRHTELVTVLLI